MAQLTGPIRIGILTTRSVVLVQRIAVEKESERSVMCINRTSTETGVSKAYNRFVNRQTGVIAKAIGETAFRVDVDGEITEGQSWELPTFLAHLLHRDNLLAGLDGVRERTAWLATGQVNADHRVSEIQGVDLKLEALALWLAQRAADYERIALFMPKSNESLAAGRLSALRQQYPGLEWRFIDHAEEAYARKAASPPQPAGARRVPAALVAVLAMVAVGGTAAFAWSQWKPTQADGGEGSSGKPKLAPVPVPVPPPPPPAPTPEPIEKAVAPAIDVSVSGLSSDAGGCFGGVRSPIGASAHVGESVALPSAPQICQLAVSAVEGDVKLNIFLTAINGQPRPAQLISNGMLHTLLDKSATTSLTVGFSKTEQFDTASKVVVLQFGQQ